MINIKNIYKALKCLVSIDSEWDCYQRHHNDVFCGIHAPEGLTPCPYYQEEYSVNIDTGECGWLSDLADYIGTMNEPEKFGVNNCN